jgi:hypothetical protein
MRQYCGLGLATLVGAAFGAAAVNGLHAQAKPPVYLISEIEVANPAAYGAEFAPQSSSCYQGGWRPLDCYRRSRWGWSKTIGRRYRHPAKTSCYSAMGQLRATKRLVQ